MISLPGIVLVDDKKEDLDALQESFTLSGYPCIPIQYKSDPENITGIDHVNLNNVHPRIIITDLNLQELQIEATQLIGPIAEVLENLVVDGLYILYFWSKNVSTVSKVMELIEQRYSDRIPFPLHWGILDKTQFKTRPEELNNKVRSLIEDNPIFNALFGWENQVSKAARQTTDAIFNLAKPNQEGLSLSDFKEQTTKSINTMLAKIGNEAIGQANAKEEPEIAIELGLEPVLYNRITSTYKPVHRSIWRDAIPDIGKRIVIDSSTKAQLNTFYHINELKADAPINKRGTWVELNNDYFELPENKEKIKSNFGKDFKTILHDEFLDSDKGTRDQRALARSSTKLGFIELSAECDQAQRKTKLHRYFLSALIPVDFSDFTYFKDKTKDTKHAGIYRLPNIMIAGQEYIVKISYMYTIGTIPNASKWLAKPLFQLKDQILTDISFKASQHSSRPGIIRFD
ncbi:hypothetical protein ACOMICROBIO_NCLOACGD_02376 [Vibrio sp. B1ASS3]|uniref:hypothetical protein n=1 Tax=Vibrio sp. B1ASS3 TaxID=2751176 RepID=UPI001ABA981C|nr:hypothetical protein [Vibrio sp. B1ASS3]CAD7811423.1 hypothetical protein ACOMICROBIO_NCLOACGD_02376 [Vibrio sp. B1ASS3]CAE6914887.1 hypothetical protein ACOMICROBIO_NCLOACGD_02376 [Vibrio sp. B1ASS3]